MTWKDLEGWHPTLLPFLFHLPLSAFFVTPPSLPPYHQEVIWGQGSLSVPGLSLLVLVGQPRPPVTLGALGGAVPGDLLLRPAWRGPRQRKGCWTCLATGHWGSRLFRPITHSLSV